MADLGRVLIVGGGVAGLTLATAFHRQGLTPELIERNPTWLEVGAGLMLHANAMRMLNAIGLGEAIVQAGVIVPRWDFCDQQGKVVCSIELKGLWGNAGPCVTIERTELQRVLVSGAAAIPCRLNTAVVSLMQDDHRVAVRFSDGSAGEYNLVVGADGIASTVRRLVLTTSAPAYLGAMNWRSVSPIRPRGLTTLQFVLGDGCFFGLAPAGRGRSFGFGYVMKERERDPLDGRLMRLRHRYAGFGDRVQEYLASLERDEQVHCSAMEWVDGGEWRNGRVLLIGDAAHASSPLMGLGGAMAMEDACVLVEELRSAQSVEAALDRYVSRRRERVKWVQQQSMAVGEVLRVAPAIRNPMMRERGGEMMHSRFAPLVAAP
jgi:FAD-dependent urate hydroxylase